MLVVLLATVLSPAAFALDTGDLVVTSIHGEVHVTVNGAERAMKAGAVLDTPSAIRTGHDGAIELAQGATTVSVGPDTQLEFPAQEKRGGAIDRIVQPRGNAFYNIGKREGRKLRVETPYLVGVIKGTQFNVAAQDAGTTISLFEGRLEVHAADGSDVVDLHAGEIAARKRGEASIGVLKMDGKAPTPAPRAAPSSGGTGGSSAPGPAAPNAAHGASQDGSLLARGVRANPAESHVNAGADPEARTSPSDANPNAAGPGADIGANVAASANVAIPAADVVANANLAATPGAVDLGASTRVDTGVLAADAGASAIVAENTSVGIAAAVNAGAGTIDIGLDVANANANAGVTTGLDTNSSSNSNATPAATPDTPSTTVVDVGGLLDGLVRRRGK